MSDVPSSTNARVVLLFVDEISEGMVRALQGQEVLSLPESLLPEGVREGDWIELSAKITPAPSTDSEARRKRLAADDPGGTIKL